MIAETPCHAVSAGVLMCPRGAVVGNLVNHDLCALEVSHGEAERGFLSRYAHNLKAGSFPPCFAMTSAAVRSLVSFSRRMGSLCP
jgi:hypothetical protein